MKNKQPLQYIAVLCCCTAVLLGAYAENAYGYKVTTTDTGAEIKWPVTSATFFINASGGPGGSDQAIQAAMTTWTNVTTSNFSFAYGGATSSTAYGVNDGKNMICFGSIGDGTTIALNTFWASISQGTMVDSDIKFNTGDFSFATDGSPAPYYDVQSIALHELGHALSLDDLYDDADSTKVMYGFGSPGQVKRVLAQDDKDGITYLYPVGGATTTTTTTGGGTTTTTGGTTTVSMPVTSSTRTTIISDPDSYGMCPGAMALGKDNPELENLRAFRDNTLAKSAAGRRITQMYYDNAESINAAFERSPALRAAARKFFETAALLVGTRQEQSFEKR
jgi:hypothetical protein